MLVDFFPRKIFCSVIFDFHFRENLRFRDEFKALPTPPPPPSPPHSSHPHPFNEGLFYSVTSNNYAHFIDQTQFKDKRHNTVHVHILQDCKELEAGNYLTAGSIIVPMGGRALRVLFVRQEFCPPKVSGRLNFRMAE